MVEFVSEVNGLSLPEKAFHLLRVILPLLIVNHLSVYLIDGVEHVFLVSTVENRQLTISRLPVGVEVEGTCLLV